MNYFAVCTARWKVNICLRAPLPSPPLPLPLPPTTILPLSPPSTSSFSFFFSVIFFIFFLFFVCPQRKKDESFYRLSSLALGILCRALLCTNLLKGMCQDRDRVLNI